MNKASKYGIAPNERIEETLVTSWSDNVTANSLIDSIKSFLVKNDLKDAHFEFNIECDYGDYRFKEMIIYCYREKTEEKILKEIEDQKSKIELQKKQRQDTEYQLFLNLKKKYEK